ncbi:MAG TPA: GDSL-type esterase/lipase family protein [Syntrophales bacterium]|nr:GDSL-type esterase/lipase family protein [Syntrophales bacterium]HOM08061.1 GDSL-type esterase/lipase family protein [Syntrophales bacterium]HON99815.1 GDSL-type esterase/lipase family protein [Syntrophales bacterium]HPC01468.1 GDSL-type esterase/lipase family protein [Syntrophales bacterium]HPQ07468.1 GDSL-type esterase/lipase family protein [Syntrophales bacterium]
MIKPRSTIAKLKEGKQVIIAALGDSLTQGWMVRMGYIDYLKEMLREQYPQAHLTIVRRGIPGDTADNGLYRLRRDVLNHNPDCVFVQYAINDAYLGFTPKQFRDYIEEIIEEIQADSEADIVLITSSYLEDAREYAYILKYYDQLVELAEKHRLPIARTDLYWKAAVEGGVDFGTLVQYDLVHPTALGYRYMAQAVMDLFREDDKGVHGGDLPVRSDL